MLEYDFMTKLMSMLDHEQNVTCKTKALLAISALVRQNSQGADGFLAKGGIYKLIQLLKIED